MNSKFEEMLMDICHEVFKMPRNKLVRGSFDPRRLEATYHVKGGEHTISKDWVVIREETKTNDEQS